MAFSPNRGSEDYRVLVDIDLDSETLSLSHWGFGLDDGTYYEGRLWSISSLRRSAGSIADPRVLTPDATLEIDDPDGVIEAKLLQSTWGNRAVVVQVGHGDAVANYSTVFTGNIRHPGGIRGGAGRLTISLSDLRSKDARPLPVNHFNTTDYPNIETKSIGKKIPYVYGDFTTTAGNGEQVNCFQTDSTVGTGGKFTIADHALKQVEYVYLNGTSVSFTADLANGGFTLNVAYAPATDTITANVQGATDDGTPSGTLLEGIPAICRDVLTERMGVSATYLVAADFTAWDTDLGTYKGRRVIDQEVPSDQIIGELLFEGFADMAIDLDGNYSPQYRTVVPGAGLDVVDADNLLLQADGTRYIYFEHDPQALFGNSFTGHYRYAPIDGVWTEKVYEESDSSITALGSRVHRALYYRWLYQESDATDRTQKELAVFSRNVELVTLGLDADFLLKLPTDQIQLNYGRFASVPLMLREVETDPERRQSVVVAWNLALLAGVVYTEDAAVTWETATAEQRQIKGFWCDDNGYAGTVLPLTEDSRVYKYA